MRPDAPVYGIADRKDIAGMTGKEFLLVISDGRVPAHGTATIMVFDGGGERPVGQA